MRYVLQRLNQKKMKPVSTQLSKVHPMTLDKNKLKELIKKTPTKDLFYLHINPVEPKSLQYALKELQKYVDKDSAQIIVLKN